MSLILRDILCLEIKRVRKREKERWNEKERSLSNIYGVFVFLKRMLQEYKDIIEEMGEMESNIMMLIQIEFTMCFI